MSKNNSMPCYIEKEWRAYLAGDIPEEERMEMAEHLLSCDCCLQGYLNLMDADHSRDYRLGEDFTERVFNEIRMIKRPAVSRSFEQTQKQPAPIAKEKRGNRINLLISYCAAASIVFFLWTGGYISSLSKTLNEGMLKNNVPISEAEEKKFGLSVGLIQNGWTKKSIQEERPSLIQHFLEKKE